MSEQRPGNENTTAGGPATSAGPLSASYRTVTLTLVALVTIIAFESLAISTIMPSAARDLDATSAYGLAFSAMVTAQLLGVVLAGVWIDRVGALRPTWVGQVIFAIGSLVAGLAPTYAVLIAGRVVAGLGGGLVVVAIYVVIGGVYPESVRPRVFAWISAAWVLPSIVGPLVAAQLASWWSWRAVFLAVVPAVVLTSIGLARNHARLTADLGEPHPSGADSREHARTARFGLYVALAAGAFQWAGSSLVPARAVPVIVAVVGVVVLALAAPRLLPAGTFSMRRGLPSVILARGLFTATFNGAVTFVPLMLVLLRGLSERDAGIILALSSLGWSFAAWVQGRPHFLGRATTLVTTGAGFALLGALSLALTSWWDLPTAGIIVGSALFGVGMGLGTTSVSVLTLQLAPPSQHAAASSAMTLSDSLGAAIGITVTGTIFATITQAHTAGPGTFAVVWFAAAVAAVVAVAAGLRTRPQREST